ncbi:DUF2085 domain-containing protein [Halobellus salinus]|uniref:DUF2085 domain-containing protein n=1 Tax=Halobellus salinus TaxID=931585 RepID=UPI001667FB00
MRDFSVQKPLTVIFRLSNRLLRPYPLCHSRPDRSLCYQGRYFGLCARCTGMYTAGLLTVLISLLWTFPLSPRLTSFLGGLLILPGGIDGVTQLVGDRESTNLLRILTGLLLGIGIVLMIKGSILWVHSQF